MTDTSTRNVPSPPEKKKRRRNARERILTTAYDLFRRQGTSHVGIDTIVREAGVAKMSLYRHFPSKQDLVAAFLQRREELWTLAWLEAEIAQRAAAPAERLLAIFDVFDEWFHSDDFDGCSFVNVLLEYPTGHPSRCLAGMHIARVRTLLEKLALEAGIRDPQTFALRWHILMKGAIVLACEGNLDAAHQAKTLARLYLDAVLPVPQSR